MTQAGSFGGPNDGSDDKDFARGGTGTDSMRRIGSGGDWAASIGDYPIMAR